MKHLRAEKTQDELMVDARRAVSLSKPIRMIRPVLPVLSLDKNKESYFDRIPKKEKSRLGSNQRQPNQIMISMRKRPDETLLGAEFPQRKPSMSPIDKILMDLKEKR